jgi:hypothetical protein
MKSLLFLTLLCLFTINSFAQEKESKFENLKGNQIGVLYNGSSYSLGYKVKKAENKHLLLRSSFANASSNRFENFNLNVGLNVNFMKDHVMSNRFFISHGWGVGSSFQTNLSQGNSLIALVPNLNYRLEFNYNLNENIYIGASLTPGLNLPISYSTSSNNLNYSIGMGASNSAQLQLFYRI